MNLAPVRTKLLAFFFYALQTTEAQRALIIYYFYVLLAVNEWNDWRNDNVIAFPFEHRQAQITNKRQTETST